MFSVKMENVMGRFLLKVRKKMKVYYHGARNHTLYVQPGNTDPNNTDWFHENGKPKLIPVKFKNGEAVVPDSLGRFLVDKGLARSSMIFIPSGKIHA